MEFSAGIHSARSWASQIIAQVIFLPIGRKKPRFPVSGAIEVSPPGAGTELDADLSLKGRAPSGEIPRGEGQNLLQIA